MRYRQKFRKALFFQVMLGIVAFCIAEANPGMLVLTGAIGWLSWFIAEGPHGKPTSKWLTHFASFVAVAWLFIDIFVLKNQIPIAMGHFTIWLQLILMYAQKTNREYGQLMVLSMLQIVGASVISVSMIYGLLLAVYSITTLVTVLLFQLKLTNDQIFDTNKKAAIDRNSVHRPKPIVSRGYKWHFRLTAISVGTVCAIVAIGTFVIIPRSDKADWAAKLAAINNAKQAGFSDVVDLSNGAPTMQSKDPVINLRITKNNKRVGSSNQHWLIRGAIQDKYEPHTKMWLRGRYPRTFDKNYYLFGNIKDFVAIGSNNEDRLVSDFTVRQTVLTNLFTLHPITRIESQHFERITFSALDQQVSNPESKSGVLMYTTTSPPNTSDRLAYAYAALRKTLVQQSDWDMHGDRNEDNLMSKYARGWRVQPERVSEFTQNILKEYGLSRDPEALYTPDDLLIAQTISDYLIHNYTYSLENPTVESQDPIISFLFDHRQGHCELFAAGFAAMCRSIGMQVRLVTGYRASDYNSLGGYYVVRMKNAHAWAEVRPGPLSGWITFDPTPPSEVAEEHAADTGVLGSLRQLYEHLEFLWIKSVVSYDANKHKQVMDRAKQSVENVKTENSWFVKVITFFKELPQNWRLERMHYTLAGIIIVLLFICIASLIRMAAAKRRRTQALQLTALPRVQRRTLLKRLRFYLHMLDLLERHGHSRPDWMSPARFAKELAEKNPEKFGIVIDLTEQFYEIRFGHRDFDAARKLSIKQQLKTLESALLGKIKTPATATSPG
ncbi:DUF4129 domain-containing transglutaminase family protein [Poriferisphaera sp. WC338]|uniref:DUF4129 domain-containing transglutaminase family protein n=1 Tax=Poriferisphaera sp. WC338 TaxID=3425129 RepID=UPI003D814BF1